MRIVVIGGVAAGTKAAAKLKREQPDAEVVLFSKGRDISYAGCGLPYYLGGEIPDREDLIVNTPAKYAGLTRVQVFTGQEAVALNAAAHTVTVRDTGTGIAREEAYDRLILAVGAEPFVPDVPGTGLPGVFTMRTPDDAIAARDWAEQNQCRRAVVVGGGFIGLEAAENLLHAGVATTLLQKGNQVLPPLDADMAAEVHAYLRGCGVELRLGAHVTGFVPDGEGLSVTLEGGEAVPADLVLLGIGVMPESELARSAGLALGVKGTIAVDEHMRTSCPDIYAVGDAVEVRHFVSGAKSHIALAGPANKQGRIAADHICGIPSTFTGSQGTSVIKLFDMTAASTGLNEKMARAAGVDYGKAITYSASHATYYPGAHNMTVKTLYDPATGRILGAQIVGFDGVDKRMDVLAAAIRAGLTAADLTELDLAYAPPYGSAKDPVNMAGYVIENLRAGRVEQHHWDEVAGLPADGSVVLLDVRTPGEVRRQGLLRPDAVNIPLDELRNRLGELDPAKKIYVNCFSGLRSYLACRILSQHGYRCSNLAGGWRFWSYNATGRAHDAAPTHLCGIPAGQGK